MSPVIAASTDYLNTKEPYGESELYMVGLLLLYRKFTPDTRMQKAIVKILKKLTATIVDYVNRHKYPGKMPMVCSQFVAQCYDDAGDAYRLKIEHGVLSKAAAMKAAGGNVMEQVIRTLEDAQREGRLISSAPFTEIPVESLPSSEALCRELKEAFAAAEGKAVIAAVSDEFAASVSRFAYANDLFLSGGRQTEDLAQKAPAELLRSLNAQQSMFVSPGDLLLHCDSLEDVGQIK